MAYNLQLSGPSRRPMSSAPTLDGLARYIVRHGAMRLMGEFVDPDGAVFERGTRVLVRTERGQEVGEVLCPSSPQAIAHLPEPTHGEIVRPLSADDQKREDELRTLSRTQFEVAGR